MESRGGQGKGNGRLNWTISSYGLKLSLLSLNPKLKSLRGLSSAFISDIYDEGKPAWLDLTKLPLPKELQCPHCALPLTFLLQVNNMIPQCLVAQSFINLNTIHAFLQFSHLLKLGLLS